MFESACVIDCETASNQKDYQGDQDDNVYCDLHVVVIGCTSCCLGHHTPISG